MGATGTKWEQLAPEEGERVGESAAQEETAGVNRIRKIDVALVLGSAAGNVVSPEGSLGQIREERNHRAVIPFQTDDSEG